MTRVIGIDPGCSGACVVLQGGQPVEWLLMPTLKEGKSTRVNAAALADWMGQQVQAAQMNDEGEGAIEVVMEAVHAMPKQGVSSSFNFGHSVGVVLGVIAALGLPVVLTTPQSWKKRAQLLGTDKDAARSRAIQIWPRWRDLDKKAKGQALADAALIAWAGGRAC